MPINRLIYIFDEAPKLSRITGEHQVFEMKPGHWLFIPAGHTAEHEQYNGLNLVSIHFRLMYYSNPDLIPISNDMYQAESGKLNGQQFYGVIAEDIVVKQKIDMSADISIII